MLIQPTEAPLKNRTRTSLLAIAFLPAIALLAFAPARAAALGPDMPAWTIRPGSAGTPDKASESPKAETAPVHDPLERTLANVAKAEELMDAGKPSEALPAIQAALLGLDGLPDTQPGVKELREKLGDLKEQCDRMSASVLETDEGADGSGTPLRKLGPINPERNERVDMWIKYFTGRGREDFQRYLARSGVYMDLLAHNLRAEGVPEELANLVFVESGFNMHARSVARAVGPWQFIRGTAKIFGLKMTPYVDQRRDPELATRAAARYLRKLYEMFDGSWPLALAAYNSGEGTVQRAIRRQRTTDFWALRLPRETKDYVPKFMAAMEIASDPERYGFEIPENSPLRYDEVVVEGAIDLREIGRVSGVEVEELERLNPVFVRHRMPGDQDGTSLKVPHGMGEQIQLALETTYSPRPLSRTELRDRKSTRLNS